MAFCIDCRQLDEASYKKLEKLFDMAMSDPLNDQEAQPRALIRAKNKVRSKGSSLEYHQCPSRCQEDQCRSVLYPELVGRESLRKYAAFCIQLGCT